MHIYIVMKFNKIVKIGVVTATKTDVATTSCKTVIFTLFFDAFTQNLCKKNPEKTFLICTHLRKFDEAAPCGTASFFINFNLLGRTLRPHFFRKVVSESNIYVVDLKPFREI